MGQLMAIVAMLIAVGGAVAMVIFGLTVSRQGATEDLGDRLTRYGSREHQAVTVQDTGRRAPGRLAQVVEQAVAERSFTGNIRRDLARADLRLTVGEWLIIRLGITALGFGGGVLLGRVTDRLVFLMGLIGVVVGFFAPVIYVKLKTRRRIKAFTHQLGDTISLMANALRAGYSLLQTMEMVSREMPPPIADEFRRVVQEVGLGINFQDAMAHLLRRIPSEDLDLMISAINIQHEIGGNLAQILEVIGHTIRERVRIKGEIAVLTAQQTISGYIISVLPIALGLAIYAISPDYISKMFKFPWVCLPIGSGIMIIAGFFVMRKITAIEV